MLKFQIENINEKEVLKRVVFTILVHLCIEVLKILWTSDKYSGLQRSKCSYVLRYYKYCGLQKILWTSEKYSGLQRSVATLL